MQDIQVKVWLNPPCVVHTQHGSVQMAQSYCALLFRPETGHEIQYEC